jgi:hypothetical protein
VTDRVDSPECEAKKCLPISVSPRSLFGRLRESTRSLIDF